MKKFLMFLILFVAMCGVVYGNALIGAGQWLLSNDVKIYNTTMTTANTVYTVTLASPTVSITIQAKGADIRYCTGGTTTEAYFTIGQDQSYYDHLSVPWGAGKVLYFWSTTAGSTIEVLQNYR